MPQKAVTKHDAQTDGLAPRAPATHSPRINPGSQRDRLPGTGPREALPMSGPKAGETFPPVTDDPDGNMVAGSQCLGDSALGKSDKMRRHLLLE
jgi:hypothetical protein